jgi:hypothetical protein
VGERGGEDKLVLMIDAASVLMQAAYCSPRLYWGELFFFSNIGNWSDYEEMMMEKFGKDLQPHRVKYWQLNR